MAIYSIYTFTNLVNGKIYVGQTRKNPEHRMRGHLKAVENGSMFIIHKAIRKHGIENFSFNVIFNVLSKDDLSSFEKQFIIENDCCVLDGDDKGYNMTRGGEAWDSDFRRQHSLKRVAAGTHPLAGENGSRRNLERIANGTHPFQGERGRQLAIALSKSRVAAGIHQFSGETGLKMQRRLLAEGNHTSQIVRTCPHCGKTGNGGGMLRWHFDKCRSANP